MIQRQVKKICANHQICHSMSSNLKRFGSISSEILHLYKSKYPNFFWGVYKGSEEKKHVESISDVGITHQHVVFF